MPNPAADVKYWEQLSLIPPNLVQVTLHVGLMLDVDHLQWQVEVTNPSTLELLALRSAMHRDLQDVEHWHQEIVSELSAALSRVIDPFSADFRTISD